MAIKIEPTPEQIKAECARIRAGWSERVHYIRAGLLVPPAIASADDDKKDQTAAVLPRRLVVDVF